MLFKSNKGPKELKTEFSRLNKEYSTVKKQVEDLEEHYGLLFLYNCKDHFNSIEILEGIRTVKKSVAVIDEIQYSNENIIDTFFKVRRSVDHILTIVESLTKKSIASLEKITPLLPLNEDVGDCKLGSLSKKILYYQGDNVFLNIDYDLYGKSLIPSPNNNGNEFTVKTYTDMLNMFVSFYSSYVRIDEYIIFQICEARKNAGLAMDSQDFIKTTDSIVYPKCEEHIKTIQNILNYIREELSLVSPDFDKVLFLMTLVVRNEILHQGEFSTMMFKEYYIKMVNREMFLYRSMSMYDYKRSLEELLKPTKGERVNKVTTSKSFVTKFLERLGGNM